MRYLEFEIEIKVNNSFSSTTDIFHHLVCCPEDTTEKEEQTTAEEIAEKHVEQCVEDFPFDGEVETTTTITCYELTKEEFCAIAKDFYTSSMEEED